ncbi:pyridoxal 4-dehydrogenase [Aureimonas sp. Leaf454]|uniref:aldo/keto reductase n=1 Tax=Aureimonas sp. Leaf454 TaxID=1736381 RepID=UPI0006F2A0B9|nr:aldo/keto reductase [Aureimonas sp. Leaf454]KQT54098.1 pyridoxal 4-dehydrogenase [Aureimonas sp. Leaf454]
MKRRRIGRTELEVTEVSFGGAAIGGLYRAVPREAALEVLGVAWDAGIRYYDTAPFYGFGLSERRTGDFLRDHPRDQYVLSTKVGRLLRPVPENEVPEHGYVDPLPFAIDYDYSHDGILRSVEFSLARLGLNRIDIAFVHDIGAYTHGAEGNERHLRDLLDGGLKALERLKSEGTIRAYGLGVNEVEVCLNVLHEAPLDCILLAGRYSLLDRSAVADLIPLCEARGTTLVVGGVFNSGILATGAVEGAHFDYGPASPDIVGRVERMSATAERLGVPLAAAALQFPLASSVVSTVLIGTAKASSLSRNLELLSSPVSDAALSSFDRDAIML